MDVTVEINQLAGMLATGIYHDALTFTNTTNQLGTTTRGVTLQVGEYVLLYDFPLDTDPGWACQRLWAFGQPTGQGGEYGSPDPTGGHTGPNCYGYNLSGDYENSLTKQWYLTTPGFDFTGYTGVQVRYWRWLGVEGTYDHAFFLANRPEEPWTAIWSSASEIADSQWTQVTHDLSAVADLQPSVILHWSMGPTNASKQYCGWNIDDIQLWGIPYAAAGVPDTDASERLALLPSSPNPFREAATIAYSLPEAGRVTVGVYDVAGRLVRNVVDGAVEAGLHAAQWDGRDGSGRPVAAGVYFCRIVALGETDTRSMVLLK